MGPCTGLFPDFHDDDNVDSMFIVPSQFLVAGFQSLLWPHSFSSFFFLILPCCADGAAYDTQPSQVSNLSERYRLGGGELTLVERSIRELRRGEVLLGSLR